MTAQPFASTRPLPGALIDSPGWLVLSWAGIVAFAAALSTLLLLGRWDELRIAACFFAPLLVVALIPHGLPSLLMAVITGCFLVSAAGWAWDWYGDFWWFDVALHFLNPLVMMAGAMFMLWKAGHLEHAPRKGLFVLWSTGIGLSLGVAWELIEVTYLPLTWPDTLLDLVMDTAGAAIGGWLAIGLIESRGLPPVGHQRLDRLHGWAARRVPAPIRLRR